MHAVTALSGSGPAYLFHLVEAMTEAGISCGLDKSMAEQLARETVIGSAKLLEQHRNISIKDFREQVTSKKGTTEAALDILMKNNAFSSLMKDAIQNAKKRSKNL